MFPKATDALQMTAVLHIMKQDLMISMGAAQTPPQLILTVTV